MFNGFGRLQDFGRFGGRRASGGGGGGGVVADYFVTNDNPSGAGSWAAVMALGSAALSGKIVEFAAGSYTAKSITSLNPAVRMTIRGAVPATALIGAYWQRVPAGGAKARIDQLTINNSTNITFENLEIVTSSWAATPTAAVSLTGTYGSLKFDRCYVHSGYRGAVDTPFNVVDDLPEYACIRATIAGGAIGTAGTYTPNGTWSGNVYTPGADVGGVNITRPLVGDLVADGTYALSTRATGGTGFAGTFTVVAGLITSVTITNAGTGYSTLVNTSTITWSGQRPMGDWLAFGFETVIGVSHTGNFEVRDCVLTDLSNAVKCAPPQTGGTATVTGCSFDRIYQDNFSTGHYGAQVPGPVYFAFNFGTRGFSKSGDGRDPHSDRFQLYMSKPPAPANTPAPGWLDVWDYGNVYIDGVTRGGVQGSLIGDNPTTAQAFEMTSVGNIIASSALPNGMSIDNVRWSYFSNNTIARYNDADTLNNTSPVNLSIRDAQSKSYSGDNIYESYQPLAGATTGVSTSGNISLGLLGATISYASAFTKGTLPTTLDQAIAYFTSIGAYAAKGATRSGLVNYAARTIDWSLLPRRAVFAGLEQQTVSTPVSSAWTKVLPADGVSCAISVTAGSTYQIADDAVGTGASVATGTAGTVLAGKFVRVNHTTPATSSGVKTTTLTIAGAANDFTTVNASSAAYPIVAFANATRFQRAVGGLGSDSHYGTMFIPRFKRASAPGTTENIFATLTGVGAIQVQVLASTGFLRIILINLAGGTIMRIDSTASICDNTYKDILASWDTTQDAEGAARALFINGVTASSSAAQFLNDPVMGPVGWSRTPGTAQYALGKGSTAALLTAELGGFWLDTTTRVDIFDPVQRAKFQPDLIGATGNGPTGTAPAVFLVEDAATWNSGGAQQGTGGAFTISGTNITDVSGAGWPV